MLKFPWVRRYKYERLKKALVDARRTMRNSSSAISTGQIEDKEVRRQLLNGIEKIDEISKEDKEFYRLLRKS